MKSLGELDVLIVGLGQIGGSLGMDLVKRRLVAEVVGFDIDRSVAGVAGGLGVVDRVGESLEAELPQADLVILAAPIREIKKLIPYVGRRMRSGGAILDVGSTKAEVLEAASGLAPIVTCIGGHPLAGSEKSGIEAARAGRFEKTTFVIVPSPGTEDRWLELVEDLVRAIGARPLTMSADEHDRLIALTSSLPYLLAEALMHLAAEHAEDYERLWDMVGGSFRSVTRVAASSLQLTLDMFLTNPKNIVRAIDEMTAELSNWRAMIESGDEVSLRSVIEEVKEKAEVVRDG